MPAESALKGLATIALLKTRYDQGRDHIDMFQPFLDDVIASSPSDELPIEEMRRRIQLEHGLRVPLNTLGTLLSRESRRGIVRRDGGRYFRVKMPARVLAEPRSAIEREHSSMARAFIVFGNEQRRPIGSEDEALQLLMSFLSENHVEFLLDEFEADEARAASGLNRKDTRLVARFIESRCQGDALLFGYLQRIVEGLVLQNALLLRDIAAAGRNFRGLQVFFDSGFLLGAIGLKGTPTRVAYAEALEIFKATDIRLRVFDKTVDELKRILTVYEDHLATASGRETLFPTDLTRFLLTNRYTPSDIRSVIALLDHDLQRLGITKVVLPKRNRKYTIDEQSLAEELRGQDAVRFRPRVLHDVDCVAGVLTMRGNIEPQVLDDARAVFASTSGSVVRSINAWYARNGGTGVPPSIHHIALSNVAWMKKPAAAQGLKTRELVAICEAALRPSRETWDTFLRHLRQLEGDARVTSDEAVAILASELTDKLLARIEDEEHVEAASVAEVVDRVRESYRQEAEQRVSAAVQEVARVSEGHRQLVIRLTGRADRVAELSSGVCFLGAALVVAYGLIVGGPEVLQRKLPHWNPDHLGLVAGLLVYVVTFCSLLYGHYLQRWRSGLESYLRANLRKWMLAGTDQTGS